MTHGKSHRQAVRPEEPGRAEVLEVIDRLMAGDITREEAALWAGARHIVEASDPIVEEALDALVAVDQWQVDDDMRRVGYLFDFDEVAALRDALRIPR